MSKLDHFTSIRYEPQERSAPECSSSPVSTTTRSPLWTKPSLRAWSRTGPWVVGDFGCGCDVARKLVGSRVREGARCSMVLALRGGGGDALSSWWWWPCRGVWTDEDRQWQAGGGGRDWGCLPCCWPRGGRQGGRWGAARGARSAVMCRKEGEGMHVISTGYNTKGDISDFLPSV